MEAGPRPEPVPPGTFHSLQLSLPHLLQSFLELAPKATSHHKGLPSQGVWATDTSIFPATSSPAPLPPTAQTPGWHLSDSAQFP